MRIAVDGMGGDLAPDAVVEGAASAADDFADVEVIVVGLDSVRPLVARHPRLRFVPASQVIAMDEHPARAVRGKRDSSMSVCARLCREGAAEGWASAGNSGAIMAAALLVQGRVKGVDRPALGSIVPTASEPVYFLDVGANVDCRPEFLVQFAEMGDVYARTLLGRERPRIGLLANGEEASKGDERTQKAHVLLREHRRLNFIGNVEPKDMLAGRADVVVADGFVGNLAIKSLEATADFLFRQLRSEIPRTLPGKVGGLLIRGNVQAMRARIDWREFGGAPLLGIDGVAVVAHGRSDGRALRNAVRVAREAVEGRLVERIREAVAA